MPKTAAKANDKEQVVLPSGYKPTDKEEYMCPKHLEYFRQKLEEWREELLKSSQKTLEELQTEEWREADENDAAGKSFNTSLELRTRDRYRKLLSKIDSALGRIENGEYGYCEETGEKIGVARLEARPIATLCIEAQERHEQYERQHIDDDVNEF